MHDRNGARRWRKTNSAQVTELGYMGIGVKDLSAWKDFATTNTIGFEVADEGESDRRSIAGLSYGYNKTIMRYK